MVQPQTTDAEFSDDGEGEESEEDALKDTLATTREALENLTAEIHELSRRTTLHRVAVVLVFVLVLAVACLTGYGFWYINDQNSEDRAQRESDLIQIENQFRTGCENAVDLQKDNRAELLEFGRYLGARNNLPAGEIDLALQELTDRFNTINPPRDCAAEAAQREQDRQSA